MKKICLLIVVSVFANLLFTACSASESKLVKLADYQNLECEKLDTTVTDEMIDEQIAYMLEKRAELVKVTDRDIVEKTDIANIYYKGRVDGKTFDNGTGTHDLDIDNSDFIPGFAEGVLGMRVGETKELYLTFPDDYSTELAGKDVVFEVTVNYILQSVIPELTDEIIEEYNCSSQDEFYQMITKKISEYLESSTNTKYREYAIEQLMKESKFEMSDKEISEHAKKLMENQESLVREQYQQTMEEYMEAYGLTDEEFEKAAKERAEEEIKIRLIKEGIAKAEGIIVTEKEYQAYLKTATEYYEYDSEKECEKELGKDYIRQSVLSDKVLEFLVKQLKIVESSKK